MGLYNRTGIPEDKGDEAMAVEYADIIKQGYRFDGNVSKEKLTEEKTGREKSGLQVLSGEKAFDLFGRIVPDCKAVFVRG